MPTGPRQPIERRCSRDAGRAVSRAHLPGRPQAAGSAPLPSASKWLPGGWHSCLDGVKALLCLALVGIHCAAVGKRATGAVVRAPAGASPVVLSPDAKRDPHAPRPPVSEQDIIKKVRRPRRRAQLREGRRLSCLGVHLSKPLSDRRDNVCLTMTSCASFVLRAPFPLSARLLPLLAGHPLVHRARLPPSVGWRLASDGRCGPYPEQGRPYSRV